MVGSVRFGEFYFVEMVFDIVRALYMFANFVVIEVLLVTVDGVAETTGPWEWLILFFIILLELFYRFRFKLLIPVFIFYRIFSIAIDWTDMLLELQTFWFGSCWRLLLHFRVAATVVNLLVSIFELRVDLLSHAYQIFEFFTFSFPFCALDHYGSSPMIKDQILIEIKVAK